MSCCGFNGNSGSIDGEAGRITDVLYDDYLLASGGVRAYTPLPLASGGVRPYRHPDGKVVSRGMRMSPPMGGNPQDHYPDYGIPGANFDGGAIKKNWLPLVVLGACLFIGIGVSEWAAKKI